jgi:hypothetical protein
MHCRCAEELSTCEPLIYRSRTACDFESQSTARSYAVRIVSRARLTSLSFSTGQARWRRGFENVAKIGTFSGRLHSDWHFPQHFKWTGSYTRLKDKPNFDAASLSNGVRRRVTNIALNRISERVDCSAIIESTFNTSNAPPQYLTPVYLHNLHLLASRQTDVISIASIAKRF